MAGNLLQGVRYWQLYIGTRREDSEYIVSEKGYNVGGFGGNMVGVVNKTSEISASSISLNAWADGSRIIYSYSIASHVVTSFGDSRKSRIFLKDGLLAGDLWNKYFQRS